MPDRIVPTDISEFSGRSVSKGVLHHPWLGRLYSWLGKTVAIGEKKQKLWINKESLTRYICEKYVAEQSVNDEAIKKIVRSGITDALRSSPKTVDELVRKVVEALAHPEILSVNTETKGSEYRIVQARDYGRLQEVFNSIKALSFPQETHPSTRGERASEGGSQRQYVPLIMDETVMGVVQKALAQADTQLNDFFRSAKQEKELPTILQNLLSHHDFPTYELIIDDLSARTGEKIEKSLASKDRVLQIAKDLASKRRLQQAALTLLKERISKIRSLYGENASIQKAKELVRAAEGVQQQMEGSKGSEYHQKSEALDASIQECQKYLELCGVQRQCQRLAEFGYDVRDLQNLLDSSDAIGVKFGTAVSELTRLGFSVNSGASLEPQIEAALVEKTATLLILLHKEPSTLDDASAVIADGVEKIRTWIGVTRAKLEAIDLHGFPLQQQACILRREALFDLWKTRLPSRDEMLQAQRLVDEVGSWEEFSTTTSALVGLFHQLHERALQISDGDEAVWQGYLTAEKDLKGILADADAKTSEPIPIDFGQLHGRIQPFQQVLEQFDHSILATMRDQCKTLKGSIEGMYLQLSPEQTTRSKLPNWKKWEGLTKENEDRLDGKALESLLRELKALEEEVKIPYTLALAHQPGEGGEQPSFAAQAAGLFRMRAACRQMKTDLGYSLEAFFVEIQKYPDLAQDGIPLLFSSKPAFLTEDEFLDNIAKAISKTASRADVITQKLVELSQVSKLKERIQQLLSRLSNSLSVDIENALESPHPADLRDVLHRMVITTHQSQGKTEDMIRLLAETIGRKDTEKRFGLVSNQLKDLFQWFPHESTQMREGIRSLAIAVQLHATEETFDFPKDLSQEMSSAIISLAASLSLQMKDLGKWETESFHTALVFHAAPDTADSPDVPVTALSQAGLLLGLERLQESVGEVPVHPIFLGTEWKFLAKGYAEFFSLLDSLSSMSRLYPGVTCIPGSIGWFDPETHLCFNTLPIFENGRLIALYSKRHEKQDMDTVASLYEVDRQTMRWAAKEESEIFDDFIRNTCLLGNGLALGIEICNDHVNDTVKEEYRRQFPRGEGLDLHLVMAHGSQLGLPRLAVRRGGSVGYIDHSGDGVTTAGRVTESKEIFATKEAHVNSNKAALGAFVTHQSDLKEIIPQFSDIQSSLVPQQMKGSACSDIFQAIGYPLSRAEFVKIIRENKSQMYPGEGFSAPESLKGALTQILNRYTFANEEDIDRFLEIVEKDEPIGDYRSQLLQCCAMAAHRPIVLYTDLASVDREVFMPDRSKPVGIPMNPLELGFSFKDKFFFTPSWARSEEYRDTKNLCTESLLLWKHEVEALSKSPKDTTIQQVEALEKSIADFRSVHEQGSISRQRAFSEVATQVDDLEQKVAELKKIVLAAERGKGALFTLFQQWAKGTSVDVSAMYHVRETCRDVGVDAHSFPEERCIEVFTTLEQFQRESSGLVERFIRGVWIDPETKRLTTGPVYVRQNTDGVAEQLESLQASLGSLVGLITKERRDQMIGCLRYLQSFYSKNERIGSSVNEFVRMLETE